VLSKGDDGDAAIDRHRLQSQEARSARASSISFLLRPVKGCWRSHSLDARRSDFHVFASTAIRSTPLSARLSRISARSCVRRCGTAHAAYARSKIAAIPWPPPMHIVTSA
jgi:hypothetical protein